MSALTFLVVWSFPQSWTEIQTAPAALMTNMAETNKAHFGYCHQGGGYNCVVDGDTFHYQGQKIRIADIDTPETHPPKCAQEARLGDLATQRLQSLLNAGPFALEQIGRDTDVYGRQLRIVTRNGASIGDDLVREGLARYYGSGRQPWC